MNNIKIGMGYDRNGHFLTATEEEIIDNALIQEKEGIEPHYAWYDYKKKRSRYSGRVACLVFA